jgi:hypothetical protein
LAAVRALGAVSPVVSALALMLALAAAPVAAQFTTVPAPATAGAPPRPSEVDNERAYRADAARHLYAAYPQRIFKGRLPPLLYSVAVVETEIDHRGQVVGVQIVRRPAVDEVAPWIVAMIQRAAPFPVPEKLSAEGRTLKFVEIWLVDRSGLFQLDALTEGQR